jgi:uncharacterized metal-binding protein
MPSGKTHDRITLWLLPWIVLVSYIITRNAELTLLGSSGFFFSGLMFGPDLDLYSVQFKRWGIFRYLWLPYQKLLRHRSFFSHGLIIGTVFRLIYLLFWLFIFSSLLIALLQLIIGFDWNWQTFTIAQFNLITKKYYLQAIACFWGLELGAMSHYLSDWIGSISKKKRKGLKPQPKNLKK